MSKVLVVSNRLREYHTKTAPVLDLFRRKEYVVSVDGTQSPQKVQEEVRRGLGLPQLAARG